MREDSGSDKSENGCPCPLRGLFSIDVLLPCKNRLTPLIDSHDRESIFVYYVERKTRLIVFTESKEILPLKYTESLTPILHSSNVMKTESSLSSAYSLSLCLLPRMQFYSQSPCVGVLRSFQHSSPLIPASECCLALCEGPRHDPLGLVSPSSGGIALRTESG